ncbi:MULTISPECIES: hypothetical protein [unclassified Actinotalea]|uniref:hypothetical protein n=1 Tax=unclassified Actinotalea TaxID=2638618 RepID=UPI0015F51BA5|nr:MULTISPECIES: hypothetical protein [unclassified Actinotalea]
MEITAQHARWISRFAWLMAIVATVAGQLHAVARARSHPGDLVESPLFAAWAEPALRALRPLLEWGDPWTVYVMYGKLWAPVVVAFIAAAYLVYRRRAPVGVERVLWRVTLGAYVVMAVSVIGAYFTPWMDAAFLLGVGAVAVIGVSGSWFGIVLLRHGFRPRVTAILVLLFAPLMVAITTVTTQGSALLPLSWGWAIAAHVAARPSAAAADETSIDLGATTTA